MSKMGSHDPVRHLQQNLWPKERSGVKLVVWFLTTKSWELTQFPCVQVACDMPLKISWWGLQLLFKPHHNKRFAREVIVPQSRGSSSLGDFGTLIWESRDKKPFGWGRLGEVQSILYGRRWWLPSSLGRGESCEFEVARGSS